MTKLGNFFVKDFNNLMAADKYVIKGDKYRFTVLSPRLIRLEYNKDKIFVNEPSQLVINRKFPEFNFQVKQEGTKLIIITTYFKLTYEINKPFLGKKLSPTENMQVELLNSDKVWYYKHPELRNFGTIPSDLENFSGTLKLDKGLYSTDGFVTLDDSNNLILNNDGDFTLRPLGSVDLYLFMYRRDFGLCLKDYYILTGYPTMIPRYMFGNIWAKNEMYSNNDIHRLVSKFKEHKIPLAAIILGNSWQKDNMPYICNDALYPNFEETINYLHSINIHLGLTLNPTLTIGKNDPYYQTVASVLGTTEQVSLIPLNNKKIALYFKLYIDALLKKNIDFFMLDYYNDKDTTTGWMLSHYHQAYQYTNYQKRSFLLTSNNKIAMHRYPIIFSGKTKVNWETLSVLPLYNAVGANMGLSVLAHAIGGYHGGTEDSELFTRYVQLATYSPIFILASDKGTYYKREPWKWNTQRLKIISDYMKFRHQLIPYLYSEMYIYHLTGAPIIQPLYYRYPEIYDEPAYRNQYYFGSQFFVAPITKKKDYVMNRVVQKFFVPSGTWYDFKSGKKYPGGHYYVSFYRDDYYPVFCKAGGIVVLSNNLDTTNLPTDIEVHIFSGLSNIYKLYEDDGITNKCDEGYNLVTNFEFNYQVNNFTLTIRPSEGKTGIVPTKRNYKIRFRNIKACQQVVATFNKVTYDVNSYFDKFDLVVEATNISTMANLVITVSGNDMIIDAVSLINDDIDDIISDLEIPTILKEKIAKILFSDMTIDKKRIAIKKLKHDDLEPKFITLFIKLLEYIVKI